MDETKSQAILADFLTRTFNPVELAQAHGISLFQLVEWARSPEIRQALQTLAELGEANTRLLAQKHAPDAVNTLAKAADNSDQSTPVARIELARRAAAQIVRIAATPSTRPKAAPKPSLRDLAYYGVELEPTGNTPGHSLMPMRTRGDPFESPRNAPPHYAA
ncbi:MAG: hypothetical protein KF866_05285 [Phycisphaeraceae bacterium]|nr:hypothetical protein [Phycisphaeraceae bacterium]MCW5754407.1 hypothetical protein [Phycisphaeraceae bacterium]